MSEATRVSEKSPDNSNFLLVPRVVWAKCQDPFTLSLWLAVKDIAGEKGECFLSTPQLADYAMMSAGMVTKCRQYLLDNGLVEGRLQQDPGFPQPVWHLSIPANIWIDNATWALQYPTIRNRMNWKTEQRAEKKERSPHESSRELSPHEKGPSPHEKGPSPHETIKDLNKDLPKIEGIDLLENAARMLGWNSRTWETFSESIEHAAFEDNAAGLWVFGLGEKAEEYQERYAKSFENALMRPVTFAE